MSESIRSSYRVVAVLLLWAGCLLSMPAVAQIAIPSLPSLPYLPLQQTGFEVPDQGTGFAYRPAGSAWSFAGGTGLAGNGSGFTVLNPAAPEGDQVLFVQGGTNGVVGQSFTAAAGRYRISVAAAQRLQAGAGLNDQTVSVRIDGVEVGQIRPPDDQYTIVATPSFVLDNTVHLLEIVGLNPMDGDNTLFLDDLKLQSLSSIGQEWSDPVTWGGSVPGPSDAAVIPAGQIVLLDTAVQVASLQIDGELHCIDKDIALTAEWVSVQGLFECGSEHSPYQQELTITLAGPDDGDNIMGMGDKFLAAMSGGTIELHGEQRLSWTQLQATANAGATSLLVADPVDWRVGDQIVVAPGHEATAEGEVVTLTAVSGDGLTLDFAPALAYQHWGEQGTYDNGAGLTWTLDERAEVGLLSRNIKIQGDDSTATNAGFGGHMMSMFGSQVHAEGIELYKMGQKQKLARYPFHWHLVQEAPGQYVRNSSIHRSFNRCVTVHGTHDTLVADNVCYDFIGHGYFLEDGIEQRNTFDHNLGIWARKPLLGEELLETDLRVGTASNGPAVFWIAHPDNTYTNNAAAGSEGTGFWYGMVDQVTGLSYQLMLPGYTINPRKASFGVFDNNRVHSSRQGFSSCRDDSGPFGMEPPNEASIVDLTVSNTGQGVWPCTPNQTQQNARFVRTMVANSQNGMQAPNPMTFEDSLFVAYTNNAPSGAQLGSGVNWRGIQVYDQGFLLDNVHFVNFDRPAMTAFIPGGGAHKLVNNRAQGVTFESSPNLFLDPDNFAQRTENGPAWWGDVVHDLDGSFVGTGHAVVSDHPLMFDGTCYQPTQVAIAGYACPYRYAHFRTENFSQIDPVTILRSDGVHETSGHIVARFINEFILDDGYYYSYRYTGGMKHEKIQVHLRNAFAGDTAVVELLDVPPTYLVNTAGWSSATDIRNLFEGAPQRYFYRDHSLFLKLQASGSDWHATDVVDVCMTGICSGPPLSLDLPSVEITSPVDGARFPAGSNITVTADLSDPQGIAGARLYLGLAKKATDNTAPYSFTMNNVPAGKYPLKLVVEDTTGQTYTAVQQLLVGEPEPRVEITSHQDYQTFAATDTLTVAFNVINWTVAPGDTHLHWLLDNVDQGALFSTAPLTVTNLSQGKHEIRIALAEADGTITAMNDTVTVYSMENAVVADFEDGLDHRGSLFPDDANMGGLRLPDFAWGTRDPVASRADGQDDINYYDVGSDGVGDSFATYRLALDPAQDWTGYQQLEIVANGALVYEAFVVDATGGSTSLGFKAVGNTTVLNLPAASALKDEVIAIDLRYDEAAIPAGPALRQHLFSLRLLP